MPTENVLEMRDGKKKLKKSIFPSCYLNIEMNKAKYVVENVNGVISFVGSKGSLSL